MSDATGDGRQVHPAAIEDYLAELRTFPPPEEFARTALVHRPGDVRQGRGRPGRFLGRAGPAP